MALFRSEFHGRTDVVRCCSHVSDEISRLENPSALCRVVELEHVRLDHECHCLGLAWSKAYLAETLELLDRTLERRLYVLNVHLYDFLSFAVSCIGHIDTYLESLSCLSALGLTVFESGLTESVAECEQRLDLLFLSPAVSYEDALLVFSHVAFCIVGSCCMSRVVLKLHREGERKLS